MFVLFWGYFGFILKLFWGYFEVIWGEKKGFGGYFGIIFGLLFFNGYFGGIFLFIFGFISWLFWCYVIFILLWGCYFGVFFSNFWVTIGLFVIFLGSYFRVMLVFILWYFFVWFLVHFGNYRLYRSLKVTTCYNRKLQVTKS